MDEMQLILSLIEGTNDLIHSVNPDGSFEFVNRAWLETLGYTDSDLENIYLVDILLPDSAMAHQELVSNILKGESKTSVEVTFVSKNREMIDVEGNLFPRREGDTIVAATGFFRNITDKKESEKKLADSRARIDFLVDLMVHDLTNINQEILSSYELLLFSPALPRQLEGFIREGLAEVERASRMILNVRKITRLDRKVPETQVCDLIGTIENAAESVNESVSDKKLILKTNAKSGQYYVVADEYLEDVFYSLLHNSMKFDPLKEVKVDINIEKVEEAPFLEIHVIDHGPGIHDKDKETILTDLSQRRDSILGLGLGLTLVKKILENYGAIISVEDRVEGDSSKGAKFVLLMRHESQETKQEAEDQ